MDADTFSSVHGDGMDAGGRATQERLPNALSKSPAAAHGLAGRRPASAEEGRLLFGYFLLATQEKVTRSPKANETLLL